MELNSLTRLISPTAISIRELSETTKVREGKVSQSQEITGKIINVTVTALRQVSILPVFETEIEKYAQTTQSIGLI